MDLKKKSKEKKRGRGKSGREKPRGRPEKGSRSGPRDGVAAAGERKAGETRLCR